ncbi:hypothetical protein LZ641_09830 [Hafnia paralvei]|uniref:hypothetical protein n=1 Tax=Hafnia paralvei TaxID=546367 RepID=UPI001034E31B|nr:hypothetical protein [Hafnia paralvei]NEY29901.1 hypothetical protein [Escherichia coli]MBU2673114.1 hypothetical protein [Hafnia paralvei]MCE9880639.1 hypothetical protein [Hafnia paralvei]MCE9906162.1 hypothetical protein [Hafnia paralvei]MCE9910469.1 hypothetical protein [Hafnia paralvei]
MTILLTVFSGVMVYVIGQIIMKMLIEPVSEQRKVISKITYDLRYYANILGNPRGMEDEEMVEVCKIMRQHSSQLHAATYLIPAYKYCCYVFGLPRPEQIKQSTGNLIRLSHGFSNSPLANQPILNVYAMQKINLALGISIPKEELLDPENEKQFIKAK